MTSIEYIKKLNKQSRYALKNAQERNAVEQEIINITEKIKCQEEILEILTANE